MPFFTHNGKLIYFAHVPKCGGTSIEHGLSNSGITLSFCDHQWRRLGPRKWSNSSPQHILIKDMARLIDMRTFDFSFTCLRDPVARFLSAYNYNRETELIASHVSVSSFVSRLEERGDYFGYEFDNHFVPAADMVPDGCKVFRLESGLDNIAQWLRAVTGDDRLDITFEHQLKSDWNTPPIPRNFLRTKMKSLLRPRTPELATLDRKLKARIEKLYIKDYERFFR